MVVVHIPGLPEGQEIKYYLDPRVKQNLDETVIPSLQKRDKDYVLIIDGLEGGGKSTLAFQLGKYVDPTLCLERVCFNPEQFKKAIYKAEKGQCVVYDEAFTGLSSRAALSAINRMLVSLMMQMRQKNLFVIIALPTFFLLDKYVALFRAKLLLHVYESKGKRGYYLVFNKKKKKWLYLSGKKTYSYTVTTRLKGRFFGTFALGDDKTEEDYRKKKSEALEKSETNQIDKMSLKYMTQRDFFIYQWINMAKLTYKEAGEIGKTCKFPLAKAQINNICNKIKENPEKTIKSIVQPLKSIII